MPFSEILFASYAESIPAVLEQAGAFELLADQKQILIKPNLVNQSAFPVTTSVESCEVLVNTLRYLEESRLSWADGRIAPGYDELPHARLYAYGRQRWNG